MNTFLKENNLKGQFLMSAEDVNNNFYIRYDDNATLEDVVLTMLNLHYEFDLAIAPTGGIDLAELGFYYDGEDTISYANYPSLTTTPDSNVTETTTTTAVTTPSQTTTRIDTRALPTNTSVAPTTKHRNF